jgi:hypothetical protein
MRQETRGYYYVNKGKINFTDDKRILKNNNRKTK